MENNKIFNFHKLFLKYKDILKLYNIMYYIDYRVSSDSVFINQTVFHFKNLNKSNVPIIIKIITDVIKLFKFDTDINKLMPLLNNTYWIAIGLDLIKNDFKIYIGIKGIRKSICKNYLLDKTENGLTNSIICIYLQNINNYKLYYTFNNKYNENINYPSYLNVNDVDFVMKMDDSFLERQKYYFFLNEKSTFRDIIISKYYNKIIKIGPIDTKKIKIISYSVDYKNNKEDLYFSIN